MLLTLLAVKPSSAAAGGGTLVEEQVVPSIAASGSSIVSYSLPGQDPSTGSARAYCVAVNRTGELRESNTQNNKACIAVNILSQPDLTFATLRIIIPSVVVTEGTQVPLKVVVANTGTSDAPKRNQERRRDDPRHDLVSDA